jgi:ATP-binding cassette subfamily B protein
VILLGVGGIAIGVIGPRISANATDLLFNGVIGRELASPRSTKEQATRGRPVSAVTTPSPICCRGMNVGTGGMAWTSVPSVERSC